MNFEKKHLFILLLLITLLLAVISCDTNEPPPPPDGEEPTLELKLEDVSCTEAWITLTTTNLQLPATLTLKQINPTKDTTSQTLNLNTQDSLLYIDSLLPNQTYKFQSVIQSFNQSSNALSVTTMDTTSHDFIFETFTFGGTAGSSTLYDVAIINENNIWAVGEINIADTSINGYTTYGAVHWDGSNWELEKLFYSNNIPVTPRGILVISPTEIYLASGSIFKWDGSSSTVQLVYSRLNLPNPNATIEKLWGSSELSIYGVGNVGSIVYYNGTFWSRIESGTELHISDIWGQKTVNGNYEILCVASDYSQWLGTKVLEITNENVLEINNGGLPQSRLYAVWFIPERSYFVAGDGFYSVKKLGERWIKDITMPPYSKTGIRGDGFNDIVLSGAYGLLRHFNGFSWKTFFNMPYLSGSFGEVKIKENIIVSTGGLNNGQAIITVGRR